MKLLTLTTVVLGKSIAIAQVTASQLIHVKKYRIVEKKKKKKKECLYTGNDSSLPVTPDIRLLVNNQFYTAEVNIVEFPLIQRPVGGLEIIDESR